jgi:hypothetical protein
VGRTLAVVGMITMVSLLLAVAVSDDHSSHRLADVKNYAGYARGSERNREKKRE